MSAQADRLFVALTIPDAVRETLSGLPRKGLDARWTHPDDLHITLRFLGPVAHASLPALIEALQRVRRPAFYVDVSGLSVFTHKDQAVLHAAVESVRKVTTLCADVTDRLTPLGFDFGLRPYVPHITLARAHSTPKALEAYIHRHDRLVNAHWQVHDFHLMRSAAPDEKGRHYTVLESFALPPY